jgi:serine/threonine protein kinase
MICSRCGTSNARSGRFCLDCGAELGKRDASARDGVTQDEEITQWQGAKKGQEVTVVDAGSDGLLGSKVAGKYRIDAKLGAGGMGAVYRATRLLIGDEVAVKILHSEQNDPTAGERFRREAQAAARLKHRNAVSIYDFGITDDGLQYLVMDLAEGESLRRIIKQQGPLTPSTSAEIINQVCAALDEAHRHNIIHRDIKPDNIMVNVGDAALQVKVLDFGIAKLRDEAVSSLTQTGGIVGTPHYMSPEQCLGEELDSRSDIYSLGVVLYEMLTGRVPFNSPVSSAIVIQHVNQPPASLRSHNVSIPPAVEAVVLSALEKRRETRPQTAGDLAQRFTTALRDGIAIPLSSSATGVGMPIDTPQSFEAIPSLPVTTLLERSSSTTGPRNGGSSDSNWRVGLIAVVLALLVVGGGVAWFIKRGQTNHQSNNKSELPNNSDSGADRVSLDFNKSFAGLAGGKFKIEMKLQRVGGELSGTYFYQPSSDVVLHGNYTTEAERWADKNNALARIDVPIRGTVDGQQDFIIEEFDGKGLKTGIFRGRFLSDTEMEGMWSKPNGKSETQFSLRDEGDKASGGNYTVVSKTIRRNNGKFKIEVNYPQLEGLSDAKVQEHFNERVRTLVTKDIGESSDEEGERGVGFSVDHRSGNLLSVVFGAYHEWTGAAHGQQYNFSYHYDLSHDKELELADFFLPGVNHLSLLSKLCAQDIAKQKRKNGMEDIDEDGAATVFEVLKADATFYPMERSLVFIFDPYQVGSYAEGYYVVKIPYSQLVAIINPNGPLASFVG